MVHPVLEALTHAEHHGGGGAHAELMRGAMHVQPVFGQTFKAGNTVAYFVIQNLCAAAGDGIEPCITQAGNRIANAQAIQLRKMNDL